MSQTLRLALIQSHLAWENPVQNRAVFTQKINSIPKKVDLIILPEMFTTGFTMNVGLMAEEMEEKTMSWLKKMSLQKECAIIGSFIASQNGNYYNRLIFMKPDGDYTIYDKRNLFTLAQEEKVFTPGKDRVTITYKNWKIRPLICYDLRFPVWSRNTSAYDLLIYIASWPKLRIAAWDTLLKARAIENMSYCVGLNRVGLDGKGYEYNGHSGIYDVLGNSLLEENPIEKETIIYATLDKSHVQNTRKKLSFLDDRDPFEFI
ncbi:nitrilase family protein [Aquimarina pacifica]|uniref:nitrilase family protein n=1 Tax=Aquimarina pacifica TaxID=1296415 RepID=UPI00046E86B5|nr:nitrilase family protein [Aquimarina pacifica]